MLRVLNFQPRTSTGVPVSDPFAEVRVLKTWTRIGVYSIIIAFGAVDYYLIGLNFWQMMYVRFASLAVATGAIEIIFKQSLKLRKRSAYPARVMVDAGAADSLNEASDIFVATLEDLLDVRAVGAISGSPAEGEFVTWSGWPEESKEPLKLALRRELAACHDEQRVVVLKAVDDLVSNGICRDEEIISLIPMIAFNQTVGVVIAAGDRRSHDLQDTELLRGIGNAIGLALDSLRQKEEIRAKEGRLRAIVTGAPVALFGLDREGVFTLLEGRALERLGVEASEFVGQSVYEALPEATDAAPAFERALNGEAVKTVVELGSTILEVELNPVRDGDGEDSAVIGVATDVTERKQAEDLIRHMAFHDTLTGLANRDLFERTLTESLSEAMAQNHQLAVLFIDLDGFKQVNDTIGHEEGDRLLREVATTLNSLVREGDFIARIGGDEFLVLLPSIRDRDEAAAVSDRVLKGLSVGRETGGQSFTLSASIGVAIFPQDGVDGTALLRRADKAMYEAKNTGKGCYVLVSR